MEGDAYLDRILACERPRGESEIVVAPGRFGIRVAGLDAGLASALEARWGSFVVPSRGPHTVELRAVRGARDLWLPHWSWMERYRVEGAVEAGRPVVRSYHFAMAPGPDGAWRLALDDEPDEPQARVVENAVRCIVARLAAEAGGFAIHAAGALRGGRAFLLAGPSRSGKTTAIDLSRGKADDLGDDMAIVLPEGEGWAAPALPFASFEQAPPRPREDLFPVAGIYRLYQAEGASVEELPKTRAVASLVACAAFPWAIPDLADGVLEAARRFVETGRFAHLHFGLASDFWSVLDADVAR